MNNKKLTDEEMNKKMVKAIKEGTFNRAQNFLGEDVVKVNGLTKDNINMKTILEIASKKFDISKFK